MKYFIISICSFMLVMLITGCAATKTEITPTSQQVGIMTATKEERTTPRITNTATPNRTAWPTATLKNTETNTPTIPATPFFHVNEIVYDAPGLIWSECEVSWDLYLSWRAAEDCFDESLPSVKRDDREVWGERFQRGVQSLNDLRLIIGDDIYETKHNRGNPIIYTLYKNGEIYAEASSYFGVYDPNQSLINVGGKAAWEVAGYEAPTVIYDGLDLRQIHNIEAAYKPYSINDKLIFVAKSDGKNLVIYDGEPVGPSFDEISIAYCCGPEGYSIRRVQGQYWFWGIRDGKFYLVRIQSLADH